MVDIDGFKIEVWRGGLIKKILKLHFLSILMITLFGCSLLEIEMVAFNSLSESERDLIPTSPKDSVVEKINVTEENKKYLFDVYDGDKVYSVTFNHTDSDKKGFDCFCSFE